MTRDGNHVWTQRWTSPIANYSAYAYSIAVDNQGNVFTTGFDERRVYRWRIHYSEIQFVRRLAMGDAYNGSTSSIDYANTLSLIATGIPTSPVGAAAQITCTIMTTIKYDPDWKRAVG